MRYVAAVLIALLGGAMSFFADWLRWHDRGGLNGIDAPSWDLYGSVFLCVGLAAFVVFAFLDIRATALAINQAKKAGRRF